jgi:CRISPR-associated endonuclease/helicase Cas3
MKADPYLSSPMTFEKDNSVTKASMADSWLHGALGLKGGESPFPWQLELVTHFLRGQLDRARALDIPTGLGKTAVMAAWLVARSCGAPVPRRLVYVVDRRAVVDQATKFAELLRAYVEANAELKQGLGLDTRALPISTLRGQYIDNREWLEDPALPAIIVGTVDMIGSRLLFGGYGVSRKMRPYHAGLLGTDALIVIDEAHLVPPFERLIETIATDEEMFRPDDEGRRCSLPRLALLSLSATGRTSSSVLFGLTEADLKHPVVKERLAAPKRVTTVLLGERQLSQVLAERAWALSGDGERPIRGIIYCNRRKDAEQTHAALGKLAGDRAALELFVGERRVFERREAAQWLESHGFLAGANLERTKPAIVIATSAGEVGVDLDADHMVCDLVTWERMVQRLGRVNRRGKGQAEVIVVLEPDPEPDKAAVAALEKDADELDDDDREVIAKHEKAVAQVRALRAALARLPEGDASPGALRDLKLRAASDPGLRRILDTATSAAPLRPGLTRPVVDAWSMTSLVDDPSKPQLAPWLRGWVDAEPQTTVVWRAYLPVRAGATKTEIEGFFEAAPPHVEEALEAPTYAVLAWLIARARAVRRQTTTEGAARPQMSDGIVAVILSSADDVRATRTLHQLDFEHMSDKNAAKRAQDDLEGLLLDATLVVDARLGGLKAGLLDAKHDDLPSTADGDRWSSTDFRVHLEQGERESESGWIESFRFVLETTPDGEASKWLLVENADTEEKRSMGHPQPLDEHQDWTRQRAQDIAKRLALPADLERALAIAARLHDEGKRALRWQRAFRAKGDRIYAKTRGPINVALLDGYRHEFGSLPYAARDPEVLALSDDLRDLVMHLIAAHHGNARPAIVTTGCEDAPPSALEDRAREIALRFVRLQRRWGPWGLAWLEALLRSADQLASKENDKRGPT